MAPLALKVVEAPVNGLDTESAPGDVVRKRAPVHENMLVDTRRARIRGNLGGATGSGDNGSFGGSDKIVAGIWTDNDQVYVAFVSKTANRAAEPHVVPAETVSGSSNLANPELTIYFFSMSNPSVIGSKTEPITEIPHCRGTSFGVGAYGFSYGGSSTISTPRGVEWIRPLIRTVASDFNPSTNSATVELVPGAPDCGQAVAAHLSRLFVLGGRDTPAGLSTIEYNTLYFTIPGATLNSDSDWRDPISGLTNKITIGEESNSDHGVALAVVGRQLVVFKRNSVYTLDGYSSSTFRVTALSKEYGCIDPWSVVEQDEGVYWMSQRGLMYYDGDGIRLMSLPVQSAFLESPFDVADPITTICRNSAIPLPNNYLLVSSSAQNIVTGQGSTAGWLMHSSGTWSNFSSLATRNPAPVASATSRYGSLLFDGNRTVRCSSLSQIEDDPIGYDIVGGTTAVIPAKWASDLIEIATPGDRAQLHRLLINSNISYDTSGGVAAGNGWRVSLLAGDRSVIVPEFTCPTLEDSTDANERITVSRHVQDGTFQEAAEFRLLMEYKAPAAGALPRLTHGEVYDCYVEYSKSRQRQST